MKLDPKQVRFLTPFMPSFRRRRLRFTGSRNVVHLQETALVVEGELLRFFFLGFERFVGGALAEWSTVTVPYSRLLFVRYNRRLALRLAVLALLVGPVLVAITSMVVGIAYLSIGVMEFVMTVAFLLGPTGLLTWFVWRGIRPGYVVAFRAKDGTPTEFQFAVRRREARQAFDAALARFRAAAAAFPGGK